MIYIVTGVMLLIIILVYKDSKEEDKRLKEWERLKKRHPELFKEDKWLKK